MSRPGRVVAVSTLAVALAACGGADSEIAAEVAEHVNTYEATGEGGDGALLEGVVRIVSGCFVVEASGYRYVPSFPEDEVSWSDDRLTYLDDTYDDGDEISLGGGASTVTNAVPESCERLRGLERWTVAQDG